MEDHEIQRVLDDLDVQLASAKIDLATYQTLVAKWNEKMRTGRSSAVGAPDPSSSRLQAIKVACPNCGAPLGDGVLATHGRYICEFCSHSFTIERAQQETEKIKKELQGWLSQLVPGVTVGSSSGSAVDASSRAFIFREKLYPSLELEFNRSLEWLEGFQEYPLFQIEAATDFPAYSSKNSPLRSEREQLAPIRNLSSKLSAPAVREFVVGKDDERKMSRMQSRVDELIFAANIVEQNAFQSADGYSTARQNALALKDLYLATMEETPDASEKEFLRACIARMEGTATVLDVLVRLRQSASGEVNGSAFAAELASASRLYQEALAISEKSGYTPMELVPWQHGVDKELSLIGLQSALLESYERAVSNRSGDFFAFQNSVLDFARQSRIPLTGPQDLAVLADALACCIEAKRGSRSLARHPDWSWVDSSVESHRRKSMVKFIGVNEVVATIDRYWHPFWLANVTYSQSEGAIFKSGSAKQALALLDATTADAVIASMVEEGSSLHSQLDSAARSDWPDPKPTIPAVVSEAAAQKALETFSRANPSYRNCRILMRKLVYLPACEAVYQSKDGRRSTVLSFVERINTDTATLRQNTNKLLRTYAD